MRWLTSLSHFTLACTLALSALPVSAAVLRVRAEAPGVADGASWETAYRAVAAALSAAQPGDEIWVAQGLYGERITLRDGVSLYGGFVGTEAARDERDPARFPTTLSGKNGGTVVTILAGVTASAVFDGFTVQDGYGSTIPPDRLTYYGGGILCRGSSPTLRNLIIRYNGADYGGGLCCVEGASPTVENCVISDNALIWGIASGGGIYCRDSTLTLSGTSVTGNLASQGAGAAFVASTVTVRACLFEANRGVSGGGIFSENATVDVTDTRFTRNIAVSSGGGVTTGIGGGLAAMSTSWVTVSRSTFLGNTSAYGGGLCTVKPAKTAVRESIFLRNSASGGGGISAFGLVLLSRCHVENNFASSGGGITVNGGVRVESCVVRGNRASTEGGGLWASSSTVTSCTIVDNHAPVAGSVIIGPSPAAMRNCIVADNSAGVFVAMNGAAVPPHLSHNCVFGNADYAYANIPDATGVNGNISADPRLSRLTFSDIHLQPDSPCRDAGDDGAIPAGRDIDDQLRKQGPHIDIGADEADGTPWRHTPVVLFVRPDGDDARDGTSWDLAKGTIQGALDAARRGDEVWVAAGDYTGSLELRTDVGLYGGFTGSETVREARDPAANRTRIIAGPASSAVWIPYPVRVGGIDGFTITGGTGTGWDYIPESTWQNYGGGVFCEGAGFIRGNRITGNTSSQGGGIYAAGAPVRIEANVIQNNTVNQAGGGVWCGGDSLVLENVIQHNRNTRGGTGSGILATGSARVAGNRIVNNADAYSGGGICVGRGVAVDLEGNTILHNRASYFGGGIAITADSAVTTVRNNTVLSNSAKDDGGGIHAAGGAPVLVGNAIAGNVALQGKGGGIALVGASGRCAGNTVLANVARNGAGLYAGAGVTTLIANNTLADNTGGYALFYADANPPATVNNIVAHNSSGLSSEADSPSGEPLRHNCLFDNGSDDEGNFPPLAGARGNVLADPRLAHRPSGNVHVQPDSPCVDAGEAFDDLDPDQDGQPRPLGAGVDIGADESDGTVWTDTAPVIRVHPGGNDAADGSSWAEAKRTIQAAAESGDPGAEVWVAEGVYAERLLLPPFTSLYGGFAGTETGRDQRDWRARETTLDGGAGGSIVTFRGGGPYATVSGFTFRNGYGEGAALSVQQASPRVDHNILTGNNALSGATIQVVQGSPSLRDNVMIANSGVAAMRLSDAPALVVNNTIVGNSGIGLSLSGTGSPGVVNNLIAHNGTGLLASSDVTPWFRHNLIGRNTQDTYGLPDPRGSDGNIGGDPYLADLAGGDWRLRSASPCIDAGDPEAPEPGERDLDGQARVQFSRVDIGADESDTPYQAVARPSRVFVRSDGDDAGDGSSWETAFRNVTAATWEVAPPGEVWVARGTYKGSVMLQAGVALYGGFAGTEAGREARDPVANPTELQGSPSSSTVTVAPGAGQDTTLDGFTLGPAIPSGSQGSYTLVQRGGAVLCVGASPTIRNNVLRRNWAREGGAIYCGDGAAPVIASNVFEFNSGQQDTVYAGPGTSPVILGNTFSSNNPYSSPNPPAYPALAVLRCEGATVLIADNTFQSNGGTGILGRNAALTIRGNTIRECSDVGIDVAGPAPVSIAGNLITKGGRGIIFDGPVSITHNRITENVEPYETTIQPYVVAIQGTGDSRITNNYLTDNKSRLGHLVHLGPGTHHLVNNTLYFNTGTVTALTVAGGSAILTNNVISFSFIRVLDGPAVFRHNVLYPVRSTDPAQAILGIDGNFSIDPRLIPMDGTLAPASPCFDAGDDAAIDWDTDLDGNPRLQGPHVDPGAFEGPAMPYKIPDVARALKIASGLSSLQDGNITRIDVDHAPGLTLADGVRLARKVAGLEANP